ncbi:MAG: DUF1080 domain-containing protein [Gemmataceae bacterium]|nr:DUF1080 domain-containing protein [Gemmataceae bacterium]
MPFEEARRGSGASFWRWLIASAALGLVILAGVLIFFTRTPSATFQITLDTKIDPELIQDGTVKYYLNGNALTADQLKRPIELKAGEHILLAKRGQVEVQRYVFVVIHSADGKEATVLLKEKTPRLDDNKVGEEGFVRLFNGKDLTGWKPKAGWRVENGLLVGGGQTLGLLLSERADYEDVHLKVEARLKKGNSGVHARVPGDAKVTGGNEAQIGNSPSFPTGSLIVAGQDRPTVRVPEVLVAMDTWFTMDVVVGFRVNIKVNDKSVVDWEDKAKRFPRGHLALQIANKATVVEFREVRVKEFTAKKDMP